MTTQVKLLFGFALAGFVIGAALGVYTFLTNRSGIAADATIFILCPPSLGAIGLDNAGFMAGIIGWVGISAMNAAWYGAIGLLIGKIVKTSK